MIIDVFQDTICPWCRIGKKHLLDAIATWKGEEITIRYRTFFLDPSLPAEGRPFRETMEATKGGKQVVDQMIHHVTEAGKRSSVTFHFDQVAKMPNTYKSHTVIKLASDNQATRLVEAIYRAYFEDGLDIGDTDILISIATTVGLDATEVRNAIESDEKRDEIQADLALAQQLQITGVPFFVLDNQLALSGAHPVENFQKAFEQLQQEKNQND